jgi:hypothetical protein
LRANVNLENIENAEKTNSNCLPISINRQTNHEKISKNAIKETEINKQKMTQI